MAKKMSRLDIMNLMGNAADQKAQQSAGANQMPNDEEDALNSQTPKAKTPVQSQKNKQVAAMKEQGKGKGKMIGPQKPKM